MRRALLVIALVLVGACSDDGDDRAGEDETTTTEQDSEGDAGGAEDQVIADEAVLTLDDMPTGWEVAPAEDEEEAQAEEDELDEAFAECLDIDVSELQSDSPTADSGFVNSDDEEVTSKVTVSASEAEIQDDIDRFRDETAQGCYVDVVSEVLATRLISSGEDVEIGEITFNELSFEDLGDDSIAFRLTVPLSSEGVDVDLYVDYVIARKGRVAVTNSFQTTFTPFDEAVALELTEIVVDRIPADA